MNCFASFIGNIFGKAREWQLSDAYYEGYREGSKSGHDSSHRSGYNEGYVEALNAVRDNRIVWAEKLCDRCHISEQRKNTRVVELANTSDSESEDSRFKS